LVNGRQRIHLILSTLLVSTLFMLYFATLLRRIIVLSSLVDGVRVRHAKDSGPKLFLVIIENVRKIFMLEGLFRSNSF